MLNKLKDDEGGFTLIELLVVILIIGILAAVALPTFLNQGKKGADAAAQSDLRSVATKVEACATQDNGYANCFSDATTPADGAVTLPDGMTKSGVSATGYTLRVSNPKGSSAWKLVSAGNGPSAPAADGAAGS